MEISLIVLLLTALFFATRWLKAEDRLKSAQLDFQNAKRLVLEIEQEHCQKYLDKKDLLKLFQAYKRELCKIKLGN